MPLAATIIDLVFGALYVVLFARIIFSWIRVSPYDETWGPIVRTVYEITEPILAPIRNALPPMGGLDFSVLIVFLLARVLRDLLFGILF